MKLKIPKDVFAPIIGYDDVKELFMGALRMYGDGLPVHFLMVGEPSSAKTLFLLCLSKIKGSVYLLGSRVSKAGLTDILIEQKPSLLLIDEIDKMDYGCYGTLLSLMETGIVVKALHKQFVKEKMETLVFAGANYEHELPAELLSRFTILRFKPYTFNQFRTIAVKILRDYGIKPRLSSYMAMAVYNQLRSRDIRDVVQLARHSLKLSQGKITKRTVNKVLKTLKKYS